MDIAPPLTSQLEAATSLLDFARRLGVVCQEHGGKMAIAMEDEDAREGVETLETALQATDLALWEVTEDSPGLSHILDHGSLGNLIELVETNSPLEYRAVLRGLCLRVLPEFFEAVEEPVLLDRGMPVQLPDRPYPIKKGVDQATGKGAKATPWAETLGKAQLLEDLPFRLYNYPAGDLLRIELDFRWRERLDEVTWAEDRLPKIATLHSVADDSTHDLEPLGALEFFDVRPKAWDLDQALAQLQRAAGVEIAVLPELCLPSPDALEIALAKEPDKYPPLIVAGSAHVREPHPSGKGEVRANESRVYLDGEQIATHRKFHPFEFQKMGGFEFERKRREALTSEPKTITVLAGARTRLAVLICADLIDDRMPAMLINSGVNLMLVPSLTPTPGTFNGAICDLASYCQGVAAIVNVELNGSDGPSPFFAMAAVPRPEAVSQSREYSAPADIPRPAVGVIDPNEPLDRAMAWLT